MKAQVLLTPASELAEQNGVRFPNESREYRVARDSLLAQEIELRRHIERVAEQRRALPAEGEVVAFARSPIQRLAALKRERGWRDLKIFSDGSGDYTRDYVSADDADLPGCSIFSRKSGLIRHFWSGEMGPKAPIPARTPAVCQI